MSLETMPPYLVLAFVMFFGFVNTHNRHINSFRGRSQAFYNFLIIYTGLSCLFGLCFLIYYGYTVKWYLPIVLVIVGGYRRWNLVRIFR
jgi:hypothetical protein